MFIYTFYYRDILNLFPDYNEFMPSEWNEMDELPEGVFELIKIAYKKDTVYTPYNFMLCYNLQDDETYHGEYMMFIPDEKFNDKIKELHKKYGSK